MKGVVREGLRYSMPIRAWPEGDRPRERLMQLGPEKLSDAELIAILLRTGSGKHSALDLARMILTESGGLEELASLSYTDLINYHGMGSAKAVTLVAAMQLANRIYFARKQNKSPVIHSPEDVYHHFAPEMTNLKHEVFKVILLTSSNRVIRMVNISEGILDSSIVHPREVFKPAIQLLAAGIILMHNHPSGNLNPSSQDIEITRRLVEAGKIMGIKVLDHIIFGVDGFTSLVEEGLISTE